MPARRTRPSKYSHRFFLTVTLVGMAALVQWSIWSIVQLGPFILFYPAVITCALYGDALLAVALSAAIAQFLFFKPQFSFALSWPEAWLQVVFLLSGLLIWRLAERLKKALSRAQEAEAELSTTLVSIGDAVIATDLEGRVTFMNPVAEEATGWSAIEAREKPLHEIFRIINEDTRKLVESPSEKVLREGVIVGLANHTALIRKDGSEIVIEDSAAPIRDLDGRMRGVVLVFRDASETKQAQRRLRESMAEAVERRAQLEAVFQSVNEGIVVFAMNGDVVLVNDAEARICGYLNAEEMKRDLAYFEKVFELSLPDGSLLPVDRWPVSRILRGETVRDQELRGRRTDTSQEWLFSFSGSPVLDQNGTQILAVVITRDITQEQRAKQALSESEERFRSLANSIPQLAWMADAEGWIYWYNQRWYDYTGTTLEEMKGWGWEKVHHPEHAQKVVEFAKAAWKRDEPWELTFPLRSRGGEWRWFLTRVVPIRNVDGKVVQWFGTNTDVTEQRQIQESLLKTEAGLREALSARDEFLSIASHELKTPVTSLKLQAQLRSKLLKQGLTSSFGPEQLRKMIEGDNRQLDRVSRLIEDMLDISRISSGMLTLHRQNFDLCSLIQEVADRYTTSFEMSGCAVSIVCCDPVHGDWDPFRIEQVVANLLMNALKYGSGHPVEVRVSREGQVARLSVRDQGIGIPKEALERIFQRFERAISANEISGLGLGLFISRQIVEMHGGRISVQSEPGKGSTFTVDLPLSSTVTATAER